ncbi:hypothetical protein DFA_02464 [Cavenderia fasciculata]|uniref:NADH dehydrogenase [ubiquinone] 1 alpha subcomplex assembly factor 3 n=1 Tax=Cavenderia fasciculata TaxID=261658 RepID=F4PZI7_CACFS|nr:uncharacterized protein DFA_02464 [Cavenderia fasciculata]EGG19216.1 hypothetical protein DFA_02464 [Cavenderia fasciculata]|eukprot:XP_004366849.1 hypothetical protein DFA_02464 [Cavenderia fasciculata]
MLKSTTKSISNVLSLHLVSKTICISLSSYTTTSSSIKYKYNNNNSNHTSSSTSQILSSSFSYPSSYCKSNNNNIITKRYYASTKGLDKANLFESGQGEQAENITIDGYAEQGFSVNKVLVPGSIVATPTLLLLWDIHSAQDITLESLSILNIIDPQLEFVIIGTGKERKALDEQLIKDVQKRFGVNIETMATINAIGTYNILVEEGRQVGAFLIPLEPCRDARQDYLVTKREYQELNESVTYSKHQKQVISDRAKRDQPLFLVDIDDDENNSNDHSSSSSSSSSKPSHSNPEKQFKATKNIQEKAPSTKLNMLGKFMMKLFKLSIILFVFLFFCIQLSVQYDKDCGIHVGSLCPIREPGDVGPCIETCDFGYGDKYSQCGQGKVCCNTGCGRTCVQRRECAWSPPLGGRRPN